MLRIATLLFAATAALSVQAQALPAPRPAAPAAVAPAGTDSAIRAALARAVPGIAIESVRPSPIVGFSEVVVSGRVIYVSNDGRYLFQGSLVRLSDRSNLTDRSEAVVRRAALAAVPAARRISFGPANARHRVTVFTDIDCGYCRRLHQHIAEYNAKGIAVDYLFFPRAGLNSESFNKAVSVWCAANRQQAMTDAKADRPVAKRTCPNSIALDYQLGQRVGVDGTPAIYAADGTHLGGYVEPAELLERLNELAVSR